MSSSCNFPEILITLTCKKSSYYCSKRLKASKCGPCIQKREPPTSIKLQTNFSYQHCIKIIWKDHQLPHYEVFRILQHAIIMTYNTASTNTGHMKPNWFLWLLNWWQILTNTFWVLQRPSTLASIKDLYTSLHSWASTWLINFNISRSSSTIKSKLGKAY